MKCAYCGRPNPAGGAAHDECDDLWTDRRDAGLCVRCGEPAAVGDIWCLSCISEGARGGPDYEVPYRGYGV